MPNKQSNNKIYLFAGAIVVGIVGYFGYNWYKKRTESKSLDDKKPSETKVFNSPIETPQSSVVPTSNPFKTSDEVLKFQQWVINTKKDKSILGKGGSTGYGDDGKWGTNSGIAWDKYGKEYLIGIPSGKTEVYADLEKDIDTIINNKYNSGQKAEKSYLRATALKYPDFVKNWAEAVRKRYDSNGSKGTTFIFANEIYDGFQAEKLINKFILGKTAFKKDGNVYAFEKADRYSANTNLYGTKKERGVVKGYFFNREQRILFLYIPSNSGSTLVWYPLSSIEKFS